MNKEVNKKQDEPVGKVSDNDWSTGLLYRDLEPGTPLYTKPQAKEWVSLTDEDEIDWKEGDSLRDLIKAIEAKLKEKNGY